MDLVERSGSTVRFHASNYPNLQNLMRKDPESYLQEFRQQYQHFQSLVELLSLQSNGSIGHGEIKVEPQFYELVTFLCHVMYCYPRETAELGAQLMTLLESIVASPAAGPAVTNSLTDLKKCLIQNLILLKNRGQIQPGMNLYNLFFDILGFGEEKPIRHMIYEFLVRDIQLQNKPSKNEKLNRILQSFLCQLWTGIKGDFGTATANTLPDKKRDRLEKLGVRLTIELYHRQVWTDQKTVNAIALASLSPKSKVSVQALAFFAGKKPKKIIEESQKDSEDEEDENDGAMEDNPAAAKVSAFTPYLLLNDPQGFVEKLFQILKNSGEKYSIRLLMVNVLSRLISFHKLVLGPFYSYILRYLRPNQRDCALILSYTAQSIHEYVPVESLEEIRNTLMRYFIAEYCSSEVITLGLNCLREICARAPSTLDVSSLAYIANFKGYKNKGVIMATRSIIAPYREKMPELLPKRDRGKPPKKSPKQSAPAANDASEETDEADVEGFFSEDSNLSDDDENGESGSLNSDVENTVEPSDMSDPEIEESIQYNEQDASEDSSSGSEFEALLTSKEGDPNDNEDQSISSEDDPFISPEKLSLGIKRKLTAEERLAHIKAGRSDRQEKYAFKKKKLACHAGSSNKEKKKTKNYLMLKHKRGGHLSRKKPTLKEKRIALKQQGLKRRK